MEINNNSIAYKTRSNTSNTSTKTKTYEKTATDNQNSKDEAYVLDLGNTAEDVTSSKTYKTDHDKIASAFNETEEKSKQLMNLVSTLFSKQAQTNSIANFDSLATSISNLKEGIKNGSITVDAETSAKAKADIAEDGYFGVEQTSERLIGFAKALSGGDPSKLEQLRSGIIAGFEKAEKIWGESLPQISQDTFNATMDKLDKWATDNGITLSPVDRM